MTYMDVGKPEITRLQKDLHLREPFVPNSSDSVVVGVCGSPAVEPPQGWFEQQTLEMV